MKMTESLPLKSCQHSIRSRNDFTRMFLPFRLDSGLQDPTDRLGKETHSLCDLFDQIVFVPDGEFGQLIGLADIVDQGIKDDFKVCDESDQLGMGCAG